MTNIQHLFSALGRQGLTRQKLAHILPEWWSPEIEATPSGAQQAKLYLAKALSLRIRPFSEDPPRVEFDLPEEKRFKRSAKTTDAEIEVAVALAKSASRIALSALDRQYVPPPPSAAAIRAHILAQGHSWVGLSQLVDYCWKIGIPVLHLATPLLGKKKMDGIAMSIQGRPSIVLSNKRTSGFLLFHLAHELGHIALGHVAANGAIVDDEIKKGDTGAERDPQEIEADRFAIELLTGNADGRLTLQKMMRAPALAELAIRYGREHQIDPTHVVLNCAHNNKEIFALCVSAANHIAAGRSDQSILTQAAHDYLIEGLSPDNEHLLRNLIA
jgi:hypothetical protein